MTNDRGRIFGIFLIGVLSNFFIELGAQLFFIETIFVLRFFTNFGSDLGYFRRHRVLWTYVVLCFLYLMSQLLTDIIRQTPFTDALRGNLAILNMLIVPIGLAVICRFDPKVAILSFIGLQLGGLLRVLIIPNQVEADNPWKFGVGIPICYLAAYAASRNTSKGLTGALRFSAILLAATGLFSIVLSARSLGGVMLGAAALLLFIVSEPRTMGTLLTRLDSPAGTVIGMLATVMVITVATFGMSEIAKTGAFGDEARKKYESQSNGVYGSFGVIIASRGDFLFAYRAITDSPLIGHGSWAKNPEYREIYWDIYDLGYLQDSEARVVANIQNADTIPSHSQLLTGWIWAGFLGLVFWLYLLRLVFAALRFAMNVAPNELPMLCAVMVMSMWHIFFSPFGSSHRVQWEFVLNIIFCLAVAHSAAERNKPHPVGS